MKKEIKNEQKWWLIDAEGQRLGRLSTRIANLLRGKDKPCFTPQKDCGDFVIVKNVKKIKLTGDKWNKKKYFSHSGHIGSFIIGSSRQLLVPWIAFLIAIEAAILKAISEESTSW